MFIAQIEATDLFSCDSVSSVECWVLHLCARHHVYLRPRDSVGFSSAFILLREALEHLFADATELCMMFPVIAIPVAGAVAVIAKICPCAHMHATTLS